VRIYKAIAYFVSEAWQSLWRSWKVSMVAVVAIGVSLFLCGAFLITFRNLSRVVAGWREEVAVVVYLGPETDRAQVEDLRFVLGAPRWVRDVVEVDEDQAARRFEQTFPRLHELARVGEGDLFPASLEAAVDPERIDAAQFAEWISGLRLHPAALLVDADQEWLDQLAAAVRVVRAAGVFIGALLVGASALTTSSILRLIAHAHREEVAIMRLVGATEFYIRGPFYCEGLFQGLGGALLAIAGLVAVFRGASGEATLVTSLLFAQPVRYQDLALVVGSGAFIGTAGAVLSLRRERGDPQVIE
jgi:cell division transport system permease protein